MWTIVILLIIFDLLLCGSFILILYKSGKNRKTPNLTDEEYKEFLKWYKEKFKKEKK